MQLIATPSNVELAKTTDGATPYIAAQNGHAAIVAQLISARCKVDLALKNGLTAISIANHHTNGHTRHYDYDSKLPHLPREGIKKNMSLSLTTQVDTYLHAILALQQEK